MSEQADYATRVHQQIGQFSNVALQLHLPEAHRYWMRHYVWPGVQAVMKCQNHIQFYANAISDTPGHKAILSVGSGDGTLEVQLAQLLVKRGLTDFAIHLTELSAIRQARAKDLVARNGLERHFAYHVLDFNSAFVAGKFDLILAHHVLHHIVELEFLFDRIAEALAPDATFATIDMIGRNGHMRWPEALAYAEQVWKFVPPHWKYNFQLNAYHEDYLNFDCSKSGFEGIRAQDVLPLLIEKFQFEAFVGGGGFVDVMLDRGYGQSIDMTKPAEHALVTFLCDMNQTLLEAGKIKPTMIFARLRQKGAYSGPPQVVRHLTPEFCVRVCD